MQIEGKIAEFERMANDLEREIKVEQDRANIHDPAHFAYPTYAKAAKSCRSKARSPSSSAWPTTWSERLRSSRIGPTSMIRRISPIRPTPRPQSHADRRQDRRVRAHGQRPGARD